MSREEEIRLIARRIWEEEGCGSGHADEHWAKAEAIWEERRKHKNKMWKRIFKTSAYMATFVFGLYFIPYFLFLLLHIDHPEFNQALASLALSGVFIFIFGFITFLVLFCIFVVIAALWRRYHPKVSAKSEQGISIGEKTLAGEPQPTVSAGRGLDSQAVPSRLSMRRYIYMLIGGISGLIYLMYYVGRAYSEGYLISLGIPRGFVNYELQDYIYFGAQVDTFLITGAFTAVLVGLLMTLFIQNAEQSRSSNNFMTKINTMFILGYLVWFDLSLLLFVYWQIFRPDLVVEKPVVLPILLVCIITLGFLIMVLYFDRDTLLRLKNGKIKWRIFITAAIITLLFSPYMSGEAWGAYKGYIIKPADFPQVELYANKELIDDIKWLPIDDGTYKSDQELYLILKTNEYVVLKTTDNSSAVYILSPSDILSTKILSLGKTK